jgi:endogenous inhibitor of DNA gyrase (YacG/DUF329 family)
VKRCPICDKEARPKKENAAFPFCSPRCKTVDLGKWLNEDYRIPAEDSVDEEPDGDGGMRH